jgi:predicted TIM-barrel fold metal-dependent hydrolase
MNLKNEVSQVELIENHPISRREFLFASIGIAALGVSVLSSCGKTVKVSEIERQSETRDSKPNIKEGQPMIIDTHTHFYDPTRPEGVPWPDPNDKVLYRRVLPVDYKALAVPQGVSGTVVVEASEWVEDNQWILDLAADELFIVGFVGNLQPGSKDFGSSLERFSANPLFRGIRPRGANIGNFEKDAFLADIEKLAAKDLEIDLLIGPEGLPDVAFLASRIPELRIVINHIAGVRIDGKLPDPMWTKGMQMAAEHPNVYCKVSGLVESAQESPAPDDIGYYTPTLDVLWDVFGEDHLIYGSNWPVSEHFADYATVQRIVMEYFKTKGQEATEKYFWKNAKAAYKWIFRSSR